MNQYERYFTTFFEEKHLNLDATFEATSPTGTWNLMPYSVVVEHIMIAPVSEQAKIADTIRRIDFANGDVLHFLRHLGAAISE